MNANKDKLHIFGLSTQLSGKIGAEYFAQGVLEV